MEMKFKIDENLPIDLVELLKQAKYDAMSILDQNLSGKADIYIASTCQSKRETNFCNIRHGFC